MPIGAILARRRFWSRFGYSFPMSASSAAGNAPACAAALAVLDVIDEQWLAEVRRKGEVLLPALGRLALQHPKTLTGWSGQGLLTGLHCGSAQIASQVVAECIRRGLLVMPAFGMRSTILIEPPLCIQDEDLAEAVRVLSEAVTKTEERFD